MNSIDNNNEQIELAPAEVVRDRIAGLVNITSAAKNTGYFLDSLVNYDPMISLGKGASTNGSLIMLPASLVLAKNYDRAMTLSLLLHEMGHASFTAGCAFKEDPQLTAYIKRRKKSLKIGEKGILNLVNVFEDIRVDTLVNHIVPNGMMYGEYLLLQLAKKNLANLQEYLNSFSNKISMFEMVILLYGYTRVYSHSTAVKTVETLFEVLLNCLKSKVSSPKAFKTGGEFDLILENIRQYQEKIKKYSGEINDKSFKADNLELIKHCVKFISKYLLDKDEGQKTKENSSNEEQQSGQKSEEQNSDGSTRNSQESNVSQTEENSTDEKADKEEANLSSGASIYGDLETDKQLKDKKILEQIEWEKGSSNGKKSANAKELYKLARKAFQDMPTKVECNKGVITVCNDIFVKNAKHQIKNTEHFFKTCKMAVHSVKFPYITKAPRHTIKPCDFENIENKYCSCNKTAKSLITKALQAYKPKMHTLPVKNGSFFRQASLYKLANGIEVKKPFNKIDKGVDINTSIVILLDVSGSMEGKEFNSLAGLLFNLQQVFEKFNSNKLKIEVIAYNCEISIIKEFNERFSKECLKKLPYPNGGTLGDEALEYAVTRLSTQKGRKIIMVMTDGCFVSASVPVRYTDLAATDIETYGIYLANYQMEKEEFQSHVENRLPKLAKWTQATDADFDTVFLELLKNLLIMAA